MDAPQAPNPSGLRIEAFPGGVTPTALDLGVSPSAPQAPGPEMRTDVP